jgi:NADH:ubiquinone oxidoreductase subunit 6 (subunit J)
MAYMALFIIVAVLEIISAALIFYFKDILHMVLALSVVFVLNSAMFMVLSQPILALLQLFIMVGGVATYVFVGVASSGYSKFKNTNYLALIILSVVITALFSIKTLQIGTIISEQNIVSGPLIAQSLTANLGMIYLLAIMLFGTGIGSIILVKKLGEKK